VPTIFVAAVAVHHDDSRHLAGGALFRPVDDGGDTEAVIGGVADALGYHALHREELSLGLDIERPPRGPYRKNRPERSALLLRGRWRGCDRNRECGQNRCDLKTWDHSERPLSKAVRFGSSARPGLRSASRVSSCGYQTTVSSSPAIPLQHSWVGIGWV